MMTSRELIFKIIRELVVRVLGKPRDIEIDESRVMYFNEKANDLIYQQISEALGKGYGYALGKLGTVELACIVSYLYQQRWSFQDLMNFFRGYPIPLFYDKEILRLNNNAGVFPATKETGDRFCNLMLQDIGVIDTLASYAWCERYITEYLLNCSTVNLDGYYAPFLYEKPWTSILKGRRILVIHPFAESIKQQYKKRELLFENPNVLPQFKSLRVVKAVQSIAGNNCGFSDWFSALEYMKKEMEKDEFDIALIGCGAYGFPLTAHAKRLGKIGIHLAGWTQMLFGIYGKRWIVDQPRYAKFINKSWIRPSIDEVPQNASKVEGGCYW
jgi:hypothetical protein